MDSDGIYFLIDSVDSFDFYLIYILHKRMELDKTCILTRWVCLFITLYLLDFDTSTCDTWAIRSSQKFLLVDQGTTS